VLAGAMSGAGFDQPGGNLPSSKINRDDMSWSAVAAAFNLASRYAHKVSREMRNSGTLNPF
jgi:hypothetical protein